MSIATPLVDATVDAVRETDRQLLDAIGRSVPVFDAAAMQQWYDQRDYDAMRRSLMARAYTSFTDISPAGDVLPQTDVYFPMTTATGTYRATGTITINKDLAQGLLKAVETPMLKVGDEVAFGPFPSEEEAAAVNKATVAAEGDYAAWQVKSPSGDLSFVICFPGIGDVDTYATLEMSKSIKTGRWYDFKDYSAQLLDRSGKPTERKHIALTAAPSPSIKVTDVGRTTTLQQPSTATAAEVVAAVKASGSQYADGLSLCEAAEQAALQAVMASITNNVAPPSSPMPPSTCDADARAAERLAQAAQAAKKEQWRDFPAKEEVWADPKSIWAFQRPDNSVFYGYFVTSATPTGGIIHLQKCTEMGARVEGVINYPFVALRELKARVVGRGEPVINPPVTFTTSRTPSGWPVKITQGQSDVTYTTAHDVAEVRGTSDRPLGGVLQRQDTLIADDFKVDSQGNPAVKHESPESFGAKLAAMAHRLAAEAAAKETATQQKETGKVTHSYYKVGDVVCTFEDVIHGFRTPWVVTAVQGEDVSCKLFGEGEERLVTLPTKELRILLTDKGTPTTISELEQLGATMPTTEVKPTSRLRRAITEATRRAPVELGLNQAHEAIVKQAARKFKGTAAEKKVVARFLTDLLGSEYGKAGLAAALATVIPQLAPLLGKHEGKADVLAEELATRSATILAVKAGSDLISLLGPLTAILSEMISSAEPPQITAGSGRSALDEISVTAAPVAATAKR